VKYAILIALTMMMMKMVMIIVTIMKVNAVMNLRVPENVGTFLSG
jgi:hypothetical protein